VDLAPLATLPHLRSVYFRASRAVNIEALHTCEALQEITINGLADADYLARLLPARPLRDLRLEGGIWPTELSALPDTPGLAELQSIQLVNNDCASIQGIERWASSLTSVTLIEIPAMRDLEPLAGLPRLNNLTLTYGGARDLRIVRELASLRTIRLYGSTHIDLTELSGIKSLIIYVGRTQKAYGAEMLGEGSKIVRTRY
jgi:hypothetical protein